MYDTSGYMLPSSQMVALGIDAEDLRELGVAPDYDAAEPFVRAILAGRSSCQVVERAYDIGSASRS